MAVPYFIAAAASSTIRILENFLSTSKDAQHYLNGEINLKQATDDIVKNIRIYVPLTTTKLICDAIVLSLTGKWIYDVVISVRLIFTKLINCGFYAFINGIKSSLKHIFSSLRNCSIALVLTEFEYLYQKQKKAMSSISIIDFCNICNQIYFLIIGSTNGLTKTIQLELIKYWLQCMGIIRAIAESHNINFIKYMNRPCSKKM